VEQGGFLLVFQQNETGWFDDWLPYPLQIAEPSPVHGKIAAPDHPLCRNFEAQDLNAWQSGVLAWNSLVSTNVNWTILIKDADRPNLAVAAECRYGKGRVLVNQFAFQYDYDKVEQRSNPAVISQVKVMAGC